jgi:hypothetical protein
MRIRFLNPSHGRRDRIFDINTRQPAACGRCIRPGLDSSSQLRGIGFSHCDRGAASTLLRHLRIPDMVQIGSGAVEGYSDVVAAEIDGLIVEGLVEVADELGMC